MVPPKEWSPLKGGLPLAAAVGGLVLLSHLRGSANRELAEKGELAQLKRGIDASRNAGNVTSLRGGVPLNPLAAQTYNETYAENALPLDYSFDKGAAVQAELAGRELAKIAGVAGALWKGMQMVNRSPDLLVRGAQAVSKPVVSRLPGPSLGTKALIGGAALGAGALATNAGKKAYEFGMEPAHDRRLGPPGPRLPQYVNQWQVPTL